MMQLKNQAIHRIYIGLALPTAEDAAKQYGLVAQYTKPDGPIQEFSIQLGQAQTIQVPLPDELIEKIRWQRTLLQGGVPIDSVDSTLASAVAGKIHKILPVNKDCMVLNYMTDWDHGEVDNIAIANNDGGVTTLVDWPAVSAENALEPGRRFLLALYSRQTDFRFKDEQAAKGAIVATEITTDWPERTCWERQPSYNFDSEVHLDLTPGEGWKLFDVTPIIRSQAEAKRTPYGIALHFADVSFSGQKQDWSGYQFVSREGKESDGKNWSDRHPVLLVVEDQP